MDSPTTDNAMHERVKVLETKVDAHERRITEHGHDIDRLKESTAAYHASTDEKLNQIVKTVDKISRQMDELQSKPIKRWDALVAALIAGIVAALVGYLAARVGLA